MLVACSKLEAGYRYLEHTADVGLRCWGATLREALMAGATGLFALMVELETVSFSVEVPIECQAGDPAALYVEMLNELLAQRDIEGVFFREMGIDQLERAEGMWRLVGVARGEVMDLQRHEPLSDVKAATYGGLDYSCDEQQGHVLQCVLDL